MIRELTPEENKEHLSKALVKLKSIDAIIDANSVKCDGQDVSETNQDS